jgi:hypothetical protein
VFRVQFRVQGSGFRVQGSGFRARGSGLGAHRDKPGAAEIWLFIRRRAQRG